MPEVTTAMADDEPCANDDEIPLIILDEDDVTAVTVPEELTFTIEEPVKDDEDTTPEELAFVEEAPVMDETTTVPEELTLVIDEPMPDDETATAATTDEDVPSDFTDVTDSLHPTSPRVQAAKKSNTCSLMCILWVPSAGSSAKLYWIM